MPETNGCVLIYNLTHGMGSWAASDFIRISLSVLKCGKQTWVLEALPFPPHYSPVCYISQCRNIANRGSISQLLRLMVWSALVHFALYFRETDSLQMSSHNVFDAASSQGASLTMPMGSDMRCRGVGYLVFLVLASWSPVLPYVPMWRLHALWESWTVSWYYCPALPPHTGFKWLLSCLHSLLLKELGLLFW